MVHRRSVPRLSPRIPLPPVDTTADWSGPPHPATTRQPVSRRVEVCWGVAAPGIDEYRAVMRSYVRMGAGVATRRGRQGAAEGGCDGNAQGVSVSVVRRQR